MGIFIEHGYKGIIDAKGLGNESLLKWFPYERRKGEDGGRRVDPHPSQPSNKHRKHRRKEGGVVPNPQLLFLIQKVLLDPVQVKK